MKKATIPSYFLRTKWAVFLVLAILLTIFGRTVETPSLTKSAIVLGIGIDYSFEDAEFEVSTQSVLVGSSSGESTSTSYLTFTATGKTIAGAMDSISRKMGLIVSLAHCNVVVFSKEALTLDHLELIYPLTGMYALPVQTIIVSCSGSPKDLLALRVGTTISSPFFLQQALINEEGSDGMLRTTAKEFLARSLSKSESNAIPYIEAVKMDSPPLTEQGDVKDAYELNFEKALVFNHTKCDLVANDYSEILAIYLSHDVVGTLNYTSEKGEAIEFKVLKKNVSLKADGVKVSATIELTADVSDVQHVDSEEILTSADEIVIRFADNLAKECEKQLLDLFEISKQSGIDFLYLQEKVYQSQGRKYLGDCLNDIDFVPSVSISVRETG